VTACYEKILKKVEIFSQEGWNKRNNASKIWNYIQETDNKKSGIVSWYNYEKWFRWRL